MKFLELGFGLTLYRSYWHLKIRMNLTIKHTPTTLHNLYIRNNVIKVRTDQKKKIHSEI